MGLMLMRGGEGLEGVLKDMDLVRPGKVSGRKLVYICRRLVCVWFQRWVEEYKIY
jgi:hypothetical protein